jgi:hypothetical protein
MLPRGKAVNPPWLCAAIQCSWDHVTFQMGSDEAQSPISPGFAPVLPWQIVSGSASGPVEPLPQATPWPVLSLTDAPDELQHDLAAMRASAVLDQVNRLPCPQGKFAAKHRHM